MKVPARLALLPLLAASLAVAMPAHPGAGTKYRRIPLEPGEKVWSGAVKQGHLMPLRPPYRFDFYANNDSNQLQPLLLGSRGLWVWSEEPFAFELTEDAVLVDDPAGAVKAGRHGTTLAEARRHAAASFFPASGRMPDELLFRQPQYNTWIELTYAQNQADVLKYARAVLANGFPPGVLMIDDTWQEDYGVWRFHPGRFPEPRAMVAELHRMGFKVMVWICPFVSPDQFLLYDALRRQRALLFEAPKGGGGWEEATEPAIVRWWNGASAELDFTSPSAVSWFSAQLKRIADEYGVDGFKFDAADMDFYPAWALSREKVTPNRHTELFARFGLDWPLNEYRAGWKMAGQPLAQRLHDKKHSWEDLGKLVPHMVATSLAGYTFSCPDLIGGGDFTSFLDRATLDQELVVRSAQTHALMPMMQFSVAPWRILDARHLAAVKGAVALREAHAGRILELARASARTGEPIVAPLEYVFPHEGLEGIRDQFMLGEDVLVAPMLERGTARRVTLPRGEWVADDGRTYRGGATHAIEVPLDRLPVFRRAPAPARGDGPRVVRWTHLSTATGDLAAPNAGDQQTSLAVADFDGDGTNDFAVTERTMAPSVVLYRRTKTGWDRMVVDDRSQHIEAGSTAFDVDGDGDQDLLVGGDWASNGVWWYENPSPRLEAAVPWKRHVVKDWGATKHHDQAFGDFDGDGAAELAFWNQGGRALYVCEIPAKPREADRWACAAVYAWSDDSEMLQRQTRPYPGFKAVNEHEGLAVADVDGDGIVDIVGGGRWFKHRGGTSYDANVIDASYQFTRAVAGQLIEGGRPEVALTVGDGWAPLVLYEWQEGTWVPRVVLPEVDCTHSFSVVDFDRDGHLDIWVAEMRLGGENPDARNQVLFGDGRGHFEPVVISEGFGLHESEIADLDGDGDLDVVGKPYSWEAPRLDVWINEGEAQ